jgi:4-hydroxybenzoate polyprenyltransferase
MGTGPYSSTWTRICILSNSDNKGKRKKKMFGVFSGVLLTVMCLLKLPLNLKLSLLIFNLLVILKTTSQLREHQENTRKVIFKKKKKNLFFLP